MPPAHSIVDKAYAYATRDGGANSEPETESESESESDPALEFEFELLVFEQSTPETGVQVPKGTVDDGEEPADAVVRELAEESGVDAAVDGSVTHLVTDRWFHDRQEVIYRRHFYHVPVDDDRDEWEHVVTGDGVDDGQTFRCYWTCPRSVSLSRDMGDYLHVLLE